MIVVGTKVRNKEDERDEDHEGLERRTPAGTPGVVTAIEDYPTQGRTYYVDFESGASLVYLESELDDLEIVKEENL